jgi:hypothetical protein
MKLGDWLILSGVVGGALGYIDSLGRAGPSRSEPEPVFFLSFVSFVIAAAAGLITAGILLRKKK